MSGLSPRRRKSRTRLAGGGRVINGSSTPMPDLQKVDFAKIMTTAAGFGIVSGSFGGPVAALLGSVIGTGFGYWAQTSNPSEDEAKTEITEKELQ